MTPREAKFAEAENEPVDNPFKDGGLTLGLQPPRRATLMGTAKVSLPPQAPAGANARRSVRKSTLPGMVEDKSDYDDKSGTGSKAPPAL
jgi:hypothetical protein